MSRRKATRIVAASVGLAAALARIGTGLVADAMRLLVGAADARRRDHRLHESDFFGRLNFRTGRFDSGNDPVGWYDED